MHILVRGDIVEHGIVEYVCRGETHFRNNIYNQEQDTCNREFRNEREEGEHRAANNPDQREGHKHRLLFTKVGVRTEDRAKEYGDHRDDNVGEAPSGGQVVRRREVVEIQGQKRRRQHNVSGVRYVVEYPALFLFSKGGLFCSFLHVSFPPCV